MLLLKNGNIYTMAGEVIEGGDVLINEGKIQEVGRNLSTSGAEVLDVTGRFVMPGIIDAHCHLGMWEDATGFEGDDGNEETEPATPHLRAIDGINPMDRCFMEAYQGGVTTAVTGPGSANVIGGLFVAVKTYGNRIDNMILKDPVALKIAFGENPKWVYGEQKKTPRTRMAIAGILREELTKAREYMDGRAKPEDDDRPEFDLRMEAIARVLRGEIPLKAHAHRADDIFTAIRIAKEFNVRLTLDHCTEGHLIADYLKEEGYPCIVGPSLTDRSKVELKNLSFETPGILSKAGVTVAIMTDHPVIPLQYITLCASLAVREGMDEMEALKAITINPAKIAGIDDRVGSIEKGKDADIAVFDGNPLDIRNRCRATIINGKIIYKRD